MQSMKLGIHNIVEWLQKHMFHQDKHQYSHYSSNRNPFCMIGIQLQSLCKSDNCPHMVNMNHLPNKLNLGNLISIFSNTICRQHMINNRYWIHRLHRGTNIHYNLIHQHNTMMDIIEHMCFHLMLNQSHANSTNQHINNRIYCFHKPHNYWHITHNHLCLNQNMYQLHKYSNTYWLQRSIYSLFHMKDNVSG